LLVEDARCGYRLPPDLYLPADEVGFSLRTNHLGLRGPANQKADNVIFGTSYAFGMSVNDGENWYDTHVDSTQWLNLGLPVGVFEWMELLRLCHQGSREFAVLMYHPNLWVHCEMYERWRASGKSVFEAFNWKTNWCACAWMTLRRIHKLRRAIRNGELLVVDHGGQRYEFHLSYAKIDVDRHSASIERNLDRLQKLMGSFRKAVVVRLRVKEELLPSAYQTAKWRSLIENYDALWLRTESVLEQLPGVEVCEPDIFRLEHYLPCDTHWNAGGNQIFGEWFQNLARARGIS
jgi:hypothetical protein